jgi:1-acyl-sn-glycerol-3-phosphate acyltransferase
LLFKLLKYPAKIALQLYCKKLVVNNPSILDIKGPLLIAANHPNSFLDAIILATIFKQPIYSLARGDVFKNKWIAKILYALNILPIYRISEGAENINSNYHTFNACIDIFKKGGIVLIFSEGICINEWHLKPLKKGTARLALMAWQQNIPLKILPIGINYNNFYQLIKTVHLNVGNCITAKIIDPKSTGGNAIIEINKIIYKALSPLVYEFLPAQQQALAQKFYSPNIFNNSVTTFLGLVGLYLHVPYYKLLKNFVQSNIKDKDHFDSFIIGVAFLTYPLYILIFCSILFFCVGPLYFFIPIFIMPNLAWLYVQTKNNLT